MVFVRPFLAAFLSILFAVSSPFPAFAASPALGILTLADRAHLEESAAFPGLSVYEGERLSTEIEGRLGVQSGRSTLALGSKTEVMLFKISGGLHVDLSAGSLYFSSVENERIDIHVADATLQPSDSQPAQALVTLLEPKVLQVSARRGSLNFSYHQEFRNLPEGGTYRIYLDAPAEPQGASGAGVHTVGTASKVTYFIVGAGAAGVAAWGIHAAATSGNGPESPAKP